MTFSERAETPRAIADDLLVGAEAIAEFIYGSKEARGKVYHLRRTSNVPIGYLGSQLCARRSRLIEWFKVQEDKNASKPTRARRKKRRDPSENGEGGSQE